MSTLTISGGILGWFIDFRVADEIFILYEEHDKPQEVIGKLFYMVWSLNYKIPPPDI